MKYQIDASNKILGRLATEIAILLRGKGQAGFDPSRSSSNEVEVIHTETIRVSGRKATQKVYWHYTGYPGGIRKTTYKELKNKDSGEVLRRAVYGMLPKNKLRSIWMKKLKIRSS